MSGEREKLRGVRIYGRLFLLSLFILSGMMGCKEDQPVDTAQPPDSLQIIRDAFDPPDVCSTCHPAHYAEWQTSMHSYAIQDPIFLRLTEIGQERSGDGLDQFCVKCHTPLGSLLQETPPGFDPGSLTSIAASGIHCDICHRISSFSRGNAVSEFGLDGMQHGPISDPEPNGFHESTFDQRYVSSQICSPCHDILSPGGLLVEATSTEWDLSPYSGMGLECQNCHMPVYSGSAAVGGPVRDNLHRHYFVGVDVPLIDFPGRDNTVAMVDDLLKNALDMSVASELRSGDTLAITVSVSNSRTGHNIPSGSAFERQMWIEVIVTDVSDGSTVYSSGLLDENSDLMDHHSALVQSGQITEDQDLVLYNNIPMKNGEEIPFFWEADEIENHTIPPFQTDVSSFLIPGLQTGRSFGISVRLLFRSFPPYTLRDIGLPELVNELPIFEVASFSGTIMTLQ